MSSPDQQTDLGRREPAADPGRREPYTDQPDQYADQPYRTDQPDAGQASADDPYPPTGEAGAPPDPAHSRLDDPGRDTGTAVGTGQGETGQGDTGQPAHDVRPASFDDSQTGGSQTGDSQTGDSQTGAAPAGRDGGDSRERLVPADRAESYSSRWDAVKGTFVDEPRQAVAQADALVGELLEELEQLFRAQRSDLEQALDADQTSTEDLRIALRRYRSFFDRLLSL